MSHRILSALAIALAALAGAAHAAPINLVVNGGFEGPVTEDGHPSGWSFMASGSPSDARVHDDFPAHSGSNSYQFGAFRGVIPAFTFGAGTPPDTISQAIETTAG